MSQISQKNTCVGVSFYESCNPQVCNFIKKRLQHTYFPVKIGKFFRAPILENICERLLLMVVNMMKVKMMMRVITKV